MRPVRLALAACAAAASIIAPLAHAQSATQIGVTVGVPVTTTTYSRDGMQTYVVYTVNVGSAGPNVVNNLYWRAKTATTVPGGTAPFANQSIVQNTTCTALDPATNDGYRVRCNVGQFRPGQTASATLFFLAPNKGATLGASPNDLVDFTVEVNYAEGVNDSPGASRTDRQVVTATPSVTLRDDLNRDQFSTAVPNSGGTFFTGELGEPQPADPWTTTVAVPGATNLFVPAVTVERTDGILESSDLLDRRISEINIANTNYFNGNPATSPRLVITLKRDLSTVRKGSKLANAVLYYTKTVTPPGGTPDDSATPDRRPVLFCSEAPGNANGPYLDEAGQWRPCIRTRESVPAKKVVTGKSTGYWKWVIEAYENGRYVN